MITTSVIFNSLKETLEDICDDPTDGEETKLIFPKWADRRGMRDNWLDFLEMGGPGLVSEKTEGAEMGTGEVVEGFTQRFISRTFAMKMIVTDEAIEDKKYDKAINAARRLKRGALKTQDVDNTNIWVRAVNAAYVGGDGVPLGSASHTLPNGGTYSNLMGTPLSPSRAALITATTNIMQYPGHDGILGTHLTPKKIVCPVAQWAAWREILGSKNNPEPGQFNGINVMNRDFDIEVVPIVYWNNTTTNWAVITDAEDGLMVFDRVKLQNRSWVDNGQGLLFYAVRYRMARGWVNARSVQFVNA